MVQLDQEDINFLEDLAEEFLRIDPKTYKAEAEELKNIIFRSKIMTPFPRINFKCSVCGKTSWMKVNLATYIVSITDLICDDCNPVEDE